MSKVGVNLTRDSGSSHVKLTRIFEMPTANDTFGVCCRRQRPLFYVSSSQSRRLVTAALSQVIFPYIHTVFPVFVQFLFLVYTYPDKIVSGNIDQTRK
jgi:hypothetical protein